AEPEFDLHAEGAAPIVVIGTTNDPATPYVWAEVLAGTLDSAVLLTWEGEGHTAYGRSNACVGAAVDAYLVDGTVPEDGLRCSPGARPRAAHGAALKSGPVVGYSRRSLPAVRGADRGAARRLSSVGRAIHS